MYCTKVLWKWCYWSRYRLFHEGSQQIWALPLSWQSLNIFSMCFNIDWYKVCSVYPVSVKFQTHFVLVYVNISWRVSAKEGMKPSMWERNIEIVDCLVVLKALWKNKSWKNVLQRNNKGIVSSAWNVRSKLFVCLLHFTVIDILMMTMTG